jgi:glycosyltransferase involved in cell wall biosynthesis
MNLILSIEAIHAPLAGIGRYAWELATRMPLHSEILSTRFMANGLWKDLPRISGVSQSEIGGSNLHLTNEPEQLNYKDMIRKRLGNLRLVSQLHTKLMPLVAANRLNKIADGVFHGPNFFVPKTHLPSVVTIHDLSTFRYPQWHPKNRVERMMVAIPDAIRRANVVLTVSEVTRQEVLREFGLPAERVKAILHGVDPQYRPRPLSELVPTLGHFGLSPGGYSLFVSTIEPRKNLINLITAYRSLPNELRLHWPLVVVGGKGWQSDEIHDEIQRASRQGWLKYLGFVSQEYLPTLYAGARLFAYPSWYEGFGLPIAEAMASGIPVITSNRSSMPEVASGAALLVEPGDVSDIAEKLKQGLTDEIWRARAIDSGIRRSAELTWSACVEETLAAYRIAGNC